MKKFLIYLMCTIILIPIIIIASFLSWSFLDARSVFKKQEKAAINFVEENYKESFELIDARDVNFNAGFSVFYFYNKEDDFYFSVNVDSNSKVYGSDYEEMSFGSLFSQDIKGNFNNLEFIVSTYYDYMNGYGQMWIKMLQDGKINEKKEYELLKYITDNFENINVEYFLLGEKEYKSFKDKPLNKITANAGFDYESHVDIVYGDELYWINDASDFDYEMYLKLKKLDEYLNDNSGSVVNPFQGNDNKARRN